MLNGKRKAVNAADTVLLVKIADAVCMAMAPSRGTHRTSRVGAVHAVILAHQPHIASGRLFVSLKKIRFQ